MERDQEIRSLKRKEDERKRIQAEQSGLKAIGSGIAWAGFWIGLGLAYSDVLASLMQTG